MKSASSLFCLLVLVSLVLVSLVLVSLVTGCGVHRDDTTGTTRRIVSEQLGISYDDAKAHTTLGNLGCDDLDVVELIMELEDSFDITISDVEFDNLGGKKGWQSISILDLANLVRKKTQP